MPEGAEGTAGLLVGEEVGRGELGDADAEAAEEAEVAGVELDVVAVADEAVDAAVDDALAGAGEGLAVEVHGAGEIEAAGGRGDDRDRELERDHRGSVPGEAAGFGGTENPLPGLVYSLRCCRFGLYSV